MPVELGIDCCFEKDGLVIAAEIYDKQGKTYDAYRVDLKDKRIKYLLPSEVKYGYASQKEFKVAMQGHDILPIGIQGRARPIS